MAQKKDEFPQVEIEIVFYIPNQKPKVWKPITRTAETLGPMVLQKAIDLFAVSYMWRDRAAFQSREYSLTIDEMRRFVDQLAMYKRMHRKDYQQTELVRRMRELKIDAKREHKSQREIERQAKRKARSDELMRRLMAGEPLHQRKP